MDDLVFDKIQMFTTSPSFLFRVVVVVQCSWLRASVHDEPNNKTGENMVCIIFI
jgi:hypothetical protein